MTVPIRTRTASSPAKGAPAEPGSIARICCGRRLRTIDIRGHEGLVFTFCSGCETIRWYAGGRPIDRGAAFDRVSRIEAANRSAMTDSRRLHPSSGSGPLPH